MRLIDQSGVATRAAALQPQEMAVMSKLWGEVLMAEGVDPEQFHACLVYALRNRKGTFPIGVNEICEAWRNMNPHLAQEREAAEMVERLTIASAYEAKKKQERKS